VRSFALKTDYQPHTLLACLDLVLTSGYSTVSGSFISIYTSLGVPAQNLITSSVMSIPASIAISKMRCPETDEPVTRGAIVIDRGQEDPAKAPVCVRDTLSVSPAEFSRSIFSMHFSKAQPSVSSLLVR